MKKRIFALLLCAALCLSVLPVASAEEGIMPISDEPIYLALGDSISTGYGLADPATESFASLVAAQGGFALVNAAVDGNTAAGILEQLSTGELDETIASAELITITAGGNDMMGALYTAVATAYNGDSTDPIGAEEILAIMTDSTDPRYFSLLMVAQQTLVGSKADGIPAFADSDAFHLALNEYISNIQAIIDHIRLYNSDAPVVLTTQYNPYASFSGMYAILNTGFAPGVEKLNESLYTLNESGLFIIADVHSIFENVVEYGENPCNSTHSPLNLDFHPNALGHELIAQTVVGMVDSLLGATDGPSTGISFTDVTDPMSQWYYHTVYAAAAAGIVAGNTDGTFAPNGELSYIETIVFAVRARQYQLGEHVYGPADQAGELNWYDPYVRYAIENRMISEFASDPYAKITRGDAAVIFATAIVGEIAYNEIDDALFASSFTDCPGTAYADAVRALATAGAVNGKEKDGVKTFDIGGKFLRSEVATIVSRLCDLVYRIEIK